MDLRFAVPRPLLICWQQPVVYALYLYCCASACIKNVRWVLICMSMAALHAFAFAFLCRLLQVCNDWILNAYRSLLLLYPFDFEAVWTDLY